MSASCLAQDHLEPERGSLNDSEALLSYFGGIRKGLLRNGALHYRARVIVVPSFKPAWAVTLIADNGENQNYFVEYALFDGRPGVSLKDTEVKRVRTTLARESGEKVQEVWLRMLRQVRYSEDPAGGGADGVQYHFSRFVPRPASDPKVPPGMMAGWVWSPEPKSLAGRLAELGESLRDYALSSPDSRKGFENEVHRRALRLLSLLDDAP
jgi:hypothetical protein